MTTKDINPKVVFKCIHLKSQPHLPWDNELTQQSPETSGFAVEKANKMENDSMEFHHVLTSCFFFVFFSYPVSKWPSGVLCNTGYPSETHLKLKSCENSFVHNIRLSCLNVLKFCKGHGSITAVLCAKFQNDWITHKWVMGEQNFTRFEFKMSFGRISYNAQHLWCLSITYTNSHHLWQTWLRVILKMKHWRELR